MYLPSRRIVAVQNPSTYPSGTLKGTVSNFNRIIILSAKGSRLQSESTPSVLYGGPLALRNCTCMPRAGHGQSLGRRLLQLVSCLARVRPRLHTSSTFPGRCHGQLPIIPSSPLPQPGPYEESVRPIRRKPDRTMWLEQTGALGSSLACQ